MDDVLICCDDRSCLRSYVQTFKEYALRELMLEIKQPQLGNCSTGVSFLGYKVLPGYMLLNGRSKKRFRTKIQEYEKMHSLGLLSDKEYTLRLTPLIAFTRHAQAKAFRRSCMQ